MIQYHSDMLIPHAPTYEPDFDIESNRITFDPARGGFVSGAIFIPMIEATDEMVEGSAEAQAWLDENF